MVDIVDNIFVNVNIDENLHRIDDVVVYQRKILNIVFVVEFFVEFVASHAPQIVTAVGEKH